LKKKILVGCAKLVKLWGIEGFYDAQLERVIFSGSGSQLLENSFQNGGQIGMKPLKE
jgi:hypothetical protein